MRDNEFPLAAGSVMFAFVFSFAFVAAFALDFALAGWWLTPVRVCGAGMPVSRHVPAS